MKVLVCGGRDYEEENHVFETLDAFHKETPITMIINGGTRGADTFSTKWAYENEIELKIEIADWASFYRSAGPIRNRKMLELYSPDLVIAFPGGLGTRDMVNASKERGFKVRIIPPKRIYYALFLHGSRISKFHPFKMICITEAYERGYVKSVPVDFPGDVSKVHLMRGVEIKEMENDET